MDARTGYTDRMTEREAQGGAPVRAVAYVRVSSEEQRRHGYSLDDRERELCIQIGLKGWELVEVDRDEGLSGADPSRPGLRRIEELAREGRLLKLQERRVALIDLADDGAITREDLKERLAAVDAESEGLGRELEEARNAEEEAERLCEPPALAQSLARGRPYLLEKTPLIREYETVHEEGKVGNWLGIYKLSSDRIRRLPE